MATKKKKKEDPRLKGGLKPEQKVFIRARVRELMTQEKGWRKVQAAYYRDDKVSAYALRVAKGWEKEEKRFLAGKRETHGLEMTQLQRELQDLQSIAGV